MFYIWHTLLITAFVFSAFALGYKLGITKWKTKQKKY